MYCPNCGNDSLQDNREKTKCMCNRCRKVFELTEVNVWYKDTAIEGANIEYTGA